jgi:hypothetical protein
VGLRAVASPRVALRHWSTETSSVGADNPKCATSNLASQACLRNPGAQFTSWFCTLQRKKGQGVKPRDLVGHHAARQRGAMFPTRPRLDHGVDHREHRSTLASSVVAKPRISGWIRSGFEHRPTLASSVVTQARLPRNVASDPVLPPLLPGCAKGSAWGSPARGRGHGRRSASRGRSKSRSCSSRCRQARPPAVMPASVSRNWYETRHVGQLRKFRVGDLLNMCDVQPDQSVTRHGFQTGSRRRARARGNCFNRPRRAALWDGRFQRPGDLWGRFNRPRRAALWDRIHLLQLDAGVPSRAVVESCDPSNFASASSPAQTPRSQPNARRKKGPRFRAAFALVR